MMYEHRVLARVLPREVRKGLSTFAEMLSSPITSILIHDRGHDFLVIEINQEWMVRFPRAPSKRAALEREKLFLSGFCPQSPLPVPQYAMGLEDIGAYRKIPGAKLSRSKLLALPQDIQESLAAQVGEFLYALHSYALPELARKSMLEGGGGWRRRAWGVFEEQLLKQFTPWERGRICKWVKEFFAMERRRAVVHGDFSGDHLLCDEGRGHLTGVIDWGDVTIDDPATDLCRVEQVPPPI
jgi:aminoglycoside 2''-phosphotransferase